VEKIEKGFNTKESFTKISSVSTYIDNLLISKKGDYWIKSATKGYFNYNPAAGKLTPYPKINDYRGVLDTQPMLEDSKVKYGFPGWAAISPGLILLLARLIVSASILMRQGLSFPKLFAPPCMKT
jgi:hypothetical protein